MTFDITKSEIISDGNHSGTYNNSCQKIIDVVKENKKTNTLLLSKNGRLGLSESSGKVALLTSGFISINRVSDDLMIFTVSSPRIIGSFCLEHVYIKAESNASLILIEYNDLIQIVSENKLWEYLMSELTFYIKQLIDRDKKVFGVTTYDVVRNLLTEISESPLEIKNASELIQQRTNISRSTIMNIISALRKGGYIDIKTGRLIKINKLPKKF